MHAHANQNETFVSALTALAGSDAVITDQAEREFYSQDIYRHGKTVAAVLRAPTVDILQQALTLAANHQVPVIARGGGMSYTDGFLATANETLLVDIGALNQVLDINTEDMYVTVQAGCTWRALNDALKPHGVRTPYWGPLSGMRATVGGALSQGSVFLGSGQHGSAADNVQSMDVLLADGTLVRTGSAVNTHATPFYRNYGPDLTGLFTGDCGALGIKVVATLPLMRTLPHERHASFGFTSIAAQMTAMNEIARQGLVSECFAFDPGLQAIRLKRSSMTEDVKSLGRVMKSEGSLLGGLKAGAKVIAAGRDFLKGLDFSMHVTIESRSSADADERLAAVRAIVGDTGKEVEATMPKVMRADPFANVNSLLGPGGERWAPVHGIFAMSRAQEAYEAAQAVFAEHAEEMGQHEMDTGVLMCTIGSSATLVEPCLYWEDAQMPIHQRFLDDDYLSNLTNFPEDLKARALVDKLRHALSAKLHTLGATHFQIGKHYPYRQDMQPGADALLQAIKAAVDPDGRMNPGVLGLGQKDN
ncbi:MAG: FAD-binding oxidoreductase [Pseudomonadota bacterium]